MMQSSARMAVSATLHCLTGCSIGEVAGLVIGTALGLNNALTIVIATVLAFVFGFGLSIRPLLKAGLAVAIAFPIVFAADSLSIVTMEIADNLTMMLVPGALNAGLDSILYWVTMFFSLVVAFIAAYPVNLYLLKRQRGHALVMKYHSGHNHHDH